MAGTVANTELIATIAVSLSAALALGFVARKLRLSTIVGYMLAGILVGPHTPGFVADQHLAEQLSEIARAAPRFVRGLHGHQAPRLHRQLSDRLHPRTARRFG